MAAQASTRTHRRQCLSWNSFHRRETGAERGPKKLPFLPSPSSVPGDEEWFEMLTDGGCRAFSVARGRLSRYRRNVATREIRAHRQPSMPPQQQDAAGAASCIRARDQRLDRCGRARGSCRSGNASGTCGVRCGYQRRRAFTRSGERGKQPETRQATNEYLTPRWASHALVPSPISRCRHASGGGTMKADTKRPHRRSGAGV